MVSAQSRLSILSGVHLCSDLDINLLSGLCVRNQNCVTSHFLTELSGRTADKSDKTMVSTLPLRGLVNFLHYSIK